VHWRLCGQVPMISSHAPNRAEAFLTRGSKIVQISLLDSPMAD
jgi:hypothetical protein